ncbi:Uncharacterised protein [Mycobacterium tuberculosis]|uniref:Uncharacterized protein n=1 Tax=Mycobacterium tuberculosis TaxID=1773 RepID=A0A655J723_MYCTX|nr:Uncharacterised protein [Mycobacterium tuberculosis]CKU48043.1 Uncharacterised protein [Mycobacterium tuberculosis]COW45100.1 Uncharacterised protein [Mycobacterium tuberculosis]
MLGGSALTAGRIGQASWWHQSSSARLSDVDCPFTTTLLLPGSSGAAVLGCVVAIQWWVCCQGVVGMVGCGSGG